MRSDVDPLITEAALLGIQTPLLQVRLYQPTKPSLSLDLSPYITSFQVTMPPNEKPGIVSLTCENPQGVISTSPLFIGDMELSVALGYLTAAGPRFLRVGRYWLDTPQHQSDNNPPKDEVTFQARDTIKLMMERAFTVDEQFTLANMSYRQAIQQAMRYVTVAGQPVGVVFDDWDPATARALDQPIVTRTAGPQAQATNVHTLVQDLVSTSHLLYYPRWDGQLRVGLMNQQSPVVMTFGGTGRARRPVFVRDMKKLSLNTKNQVHIYGTNVTADAKDVQNIAAIGRVKYAFINDPTITDTTTAATRATQELQLQSRLSEQPDFSAPWIPELERRDLIMVDDQGASGIARGVYRIEDIQFDYTGGNSPDAKMQLGMGKAYPEELVLNSSVLYDQGGTSITGS